jgi:hypothetical protein
MNVGKDREDLPFGWFDWIELALTWQVSEQDETYIEKKKEREREQEIAARSVNINQASLSYTWACREQAGEQSSVRQSVDRL